jgi:hypothetical protein
MKPRRPNPDTGRPKAIPALRVLPTALLDSPLVPAAPDGATVAGAGFRHEARANDAALTGNLKRLRLGA